MTIVDAYGARKMADVMNDTWGHLAPKKGRTYTGSVLFADASFNAGVVVIDYDFGDLPGSPWLMEDLLDAAFDWAQQQPGDAEGRIFRFTGTYRNRQFTGEVVTLDIPVHTPPATTPPATTPPAETGQQEGGK